ncbi:YacL family protein [Vibrio diazotrophicus]|uniref:YacL family protein n=1 Tax=Vibrio diazotrophicus TaxID=685 RepID=UPI000C9EAF51|nr:YacL family protein [Vibrio diazotrophicus]PNH81680.1 hypothetical protein C1N27_06220 [Vibrio diazotrophicus]
MEFEFTKNTLMGEYYVSCNMEHQIVARWLQEEIGKDRTKIEQIFSLLDQVHQSPAKEWKLAGKEISLSVLGSEVTVQENALGYSHDIEFESEFELYDSESTAECGLEDFESMMRQWGEFIQNY